MLRGELCLHLARKWIEQVWYFKGASIAFVVDIADKLNPHLFAQRENLLEVRWRLCILERGTLARAGMILVPGGVFQEDMIISNRQWQECKPTIALTYVQILSLKREALDDVLQDYPKQQKVIRKAAVKIAFRRALISVSRQPKTKTVSAPSLLSAFDVLEEKERAVEVESTSQASVAHIMEPLHALRGEVSQLKAQLAGGGQQNKAHDSAVAVILDIRDCVRAMAKTVATAVATPETATTVKGVTGQGSNVKVQTGCGIFAPPSAK